MKTLVKTRLIVIALITLFGVALYTPALANDGKNNPVELKYLGEYKDQPVFELSFNGQDGNEFIVVIRDEDGNIIHKGYVKAGTASKKYMITNELDNVNNLQFEITGRKTDKTVVFQVNKNSRVVEDLVVNKIK